MDNKEILGWFNHRVYPTMAVFIGYFMFFAPVLAFIGLQQSDYATALMIVSVVVGLFTLLMTWGLIGDMKTLASCMSRELAESPWGKSFKGFAAFGIIFTLFIVGVVIAHAMILFANDKGFEGERGSHGSDTRSSGAEQRRSWSPWDWQPHR